MNKIFPTWYLYFASFFFSLYIATFLFYLQGGSGVRFIDIGRAGFSFNRHFDKKLYKINDTLAFNIAGIYTDYPHISVVKYTKQSLPLSVLCGVNSLDGNVLNFADYHHGDFIYSGYPHFSGPDVFNLKTGETFEVEAPTPPSGEKVDTSQLKIYGEHNLTFEENKTITPQWLADNYQALSTNQESCVTFTLAYMVILVPLMIMGAFFFIKALWKYR